MMSLKRAPRRTMWAAAGVLAALLALTIIPVASSGFTLEADAPAGLLMPNTGRASVNLTATVDCATALSGGGGAGPAAFYVTVATPEAPSGVDVTGPLTFTMDTSPCVKAPLGNAHTRQAFSVGADTTAPALRPLAIGFNATLRSSTPVAGESHAQAASTITVAYRGILVVDAPQTIFQVTPGGRQDVVVRLINHGNAATDAFVDIGNLSGIGTLETTPVVAVVDGTETILHFTAKDSPGADNVEQTVTLTFTPHAHADPSQIGDPVHVVVLFRVRSPLAAPAPGVLTGLVLLAAVAVARRFC